jgi:5-methylcytosine-specific restriction endonuclease McrA
MGEARRLRIYLACNGRCSCGAKVEMAGTVIDHRIPLFMGGADDDSNLRFLCASCDRVKTSGDLKGCAKVRRIIAREDGSRRPRKAIASRGFDKTKTKKFSGEIVAR